MDTYIFFADYDWKVIISRSLSGISGAFVRLQKKKKKVRQD